MQTAAQICFLAALGRRGGSTSAEYTAIIDAIREVTEKFGDSRFRSFRQNPFHQVLPDMSAALSERPKNNHYQGVLGYHDFHDGEGLWAFTETGFREIVSSIVEPRMAAQMLAEKGASLYHESDRRYRWAKKNRWQDNQIVCGESKRARTRLRTDLYARTSRYEKS